MNLSVAEVLKKAGSFKDVAERVQYLKKKYVHQWRHLCDDTFEWLFERPLLLPHDKGIRYWRS